MVTTSPTRTTAVSSLATGTWRAPAVIGSTVTVPVAVEVPLDTAYSTSTDSVIEPAAETCSRALLTTVAVTPDPSGTVADCRTRMPPAGSKSLVRGATVEDSPGRSRAVSFSGTGGVEASDCSTTSTRTIPCDTDDPADTS